MVETIGWALIHFIWQGTSIGILVATMLFFLRRNSASVRYSLSCVALAVMLAFPTFAVIQGVMDAGRTSAGTQDESAGCASCTGAQSLATAAAPEPTIPAQNLVNFESWLPLTVQLWFAGVAVLSLRMMGSWVFVQKLRRRATAPAIHICVSTAALARRMRVTRPVRILESGLVKVPTAIGSLRPVILLPAAALTGLSPEQIEAVLAHELAHIRRYDYIVNMAQTMVETLLFYHPAVWYVSRRIRLERENCCDDLAVEVCGNRLIYAKTLADLEALRSPEIVLTMSATGGSLLSRVHRILDGSPTNRRTGPAWIAVSLMAVTLVLTLNERDKVEAGIPQPSPEIQRRTAPPAPPAPPPPQPPPAPPAPQTTMNGEGRISWSNNGTRLDIRYKGTITLSDDDRDITAISPNGYVEISDGGLLRSNTRVELRARSDGQLERRFFTDGREVPYEPRGREWLANTLPELLRRSGIAADQRVSRILKQSGPSGVLNEISRIDSDYVGRVYYKALLDQAQPTSTLAIQALSQASSDITSDYELAELLISTSTIANADDSARVAYFDAARSIDSDYELRRVLTHATSQRMDRRPLEAALTAAKSIESDYEMAEFLIALANAQTLDPSISKAYFEAVQEVGSDYECRRVLSAIAERNVSDELLVEVLRSAGTLESDYERATLLVLIAGKYPLSRVTREVYLGLTDGMSSDYERNRALTALLKKD